MNQFEERTENQINENWLPVITNTAYEISDLGRLRRTYKNGKTTIIQPLSNGRKSRYLFHVIDGIKYYVHHLVAFHFIGKKPDGHEVDHIDRNPTNNALSNLRYLTIGENRSQKGTEHPNHKLSDEKVRIIRNLYALGGITQKQIGELFRVSARTISGITRYQGWSHVY